MKSIHGALVKMFGRTAASSPGLALAFVLASAASAHAQAQTGMKEVASAVAEALGRQDYAKAAPWVRIAAGRGDPLYQDMLGGMYAGGKGVVQDYQEARRWWTQAADRNIPSSQSDPGTLYAQGQGTPVDFAEAYKWFSLAAAQGVAQAVKNLKSILAVMTPEEIAEGKKRVEAWSRR